MVVCHAGRDPASRWANDEKLKEISASAGMTADPKHLRDSVRRRSLPVDRQPEDALRMRSCCRGANGGVACGASYFAPENPVVCVLPLRRGRRECRLPADSFYVPPRGGFVKEEAGLLGTNLIEVA